MIAFVSGKRIVVDQAQRTVKVQGRSHLDEYPFEKARDRVKLYEGLRAKHAKSPRDFYAASLAAAQHAADMVAQVEVQAHDRS
jgi:hypothetical protein